MASCMHKLERIDPKQYSGRRWHCRTCNTLFKISTGIIVRNEMGPITASAVIRLHDWQMMRRLAQRVILEWLDDVYRDGHMTLAVRVDLIRVIAAVRREVAR